MKKLLAMLMIMLVSFTGCNSSSGNDKDDNGGNNNGTGGSYTVSGSVRLGSAEGAAISGVTVVLAAVSMTGVNPQTVTTGSTGAFAFSNIAPGNYIITPAKSGYTFSPEFVSFTVADKNVTVQTFVGATVNTGGNAGSHTLAPFKTGATWTFDSVYSVGGFSLNEKVVEKVTGTVAKGGKTYWAVTFTTYDSDGKLDTENTIYLRVENETVYTYGTDFFTSKTAPATFKSAQTPAVMKALAYSDDLPMLKFNVSPGTTWDIVRDTTTYQGNSATIIITGKYVGTETVGSYANCAKFELNYGSESVYNEMKISGKWDKTLWLAPNVGPVKSIDNFSTGTTIADAALLSTTTSTLSSHVIP